MADPGKDGTPAWAYDEDGYCHVCGNGRWKYHMPECELRDTLDRLEALEEIRQRVADGWAKYRQDDPNGPPTYYWFRGNLTHRERMRPEVAALLWPSTGDDDA